MSLCCSFFFCKKQEQIISNNIQWIAPKNCLYLIEDKPNNNKRGPLYQPCVFLYLNYNSYPHYPWITVKCYQLKKIQTQTNIVLIYIVNKNSIDNPNKTTIIYSHSNKGDLSTYLPFLFDLCTQLKRSIISYDYSGYGHSEGIPSNAAVNTDIEHVIDFSINNLKINKSNIILIGHSTGAMPSIHLAAQGDYCSIKGMILISPFIFDPRSFESHNNKKNEEPIDYLELSTEVLCNVLLIHGKMDTIVSSDQSELLKEKLRYCFFWINDKANHTNLFTYCRNKTYGKILKFIHTLEESIYHNKIINTLKSSNICSSEHSNSMLILNNSFNSKLEIELMTQPNNNELKF